MSTEQPPLDPQLIEQTKQQIRALYAEIAQFARNAGTAEEFYAEMLPRVIHALAAVGGVIWARREQGPVELQYQMNLQESRLAESSEEDQARHGRLLQKVLTTGEGMLVSPHSGAGDSDQAANPTDWLIVLGPLKTELEVIGVVEIFQRPGADVPIQRGYLRFLLEVCALASEFLNSRQLRNFSDRQVLWTQLEEFTRLIHTSLNPRDTAYTIANEGRRLIECDRVSVAVRKGGKCTIEAVSGQDIVDKRSNTVRLLGRLATVVVASEEPMWYTGDTRDMAPQVEDAVQEYVDESHTKMIAVLPLTRPKPPEKEKERPDEPDDSPRPIGALIVEQIEDSRIAPRMLSRVEVVAEHSSTAMANALEHENVFLMPLWRTLGKTRWVIEARNLPKTAAVAVGLVAILVALFFIPADLRLYAKGTLEPEMHHDVFAGIGVDAKVADLKVEHGAFVKKGDVLAVLESFKLKEDLTTIEGQIETSTSEVERLENQLSRNRNQLSTDEEIRYVGELAKARAGLKSLESQKHTYDQQKKDLLVTSPADGVVITWNLRERLDKRPVERGQVLMRLADPAGPWQLELLMSDDRMGYITQAQNVLRDQVRDRLRKELREKMREPVREKLRAELKAQDTNTPTTPANGDKPSASSSTSESTIIRGQAPEATDATAPAKSAGAADSDGSPSQPAPAAGDPAPSVPATPPAEPAAPPAAGSSDQAPQPGAGSEAPQPAPSPETDLDKRVAQQLESRLDQEVEAVIRTIPADQLAKRLKQESGVEMEDRLRVSYTVSGDWGTTHYGFVTEIQTTAEVRGEEGNTVLIKVAINKDELLAQHILPGKTVTAKVECGPSKLGFVWFHDVLAFFEKSWFRWF